METNLTIKKSVTDTTKIKAKSLIDANNYLIILGIILPEINGYVEEFIKSENQQGVLLSSFCYLEEEVFVTHLNAVWVAKVKFKINSEKQEITPIITSFGRFL